MRVWAGGALALAALLPLGPVASAAPPGDASRPQLFDAGSSVDGLALTAVLERDEAAGHASFVYGDCDASDDAGCAPPVEIQVWPSCRRHLGLYRAGSPLGPDAEAATIRGVPAAFLDDGSRLELQTGRSTVVVFAESRARVVRIAHALRAVDGSVPPGVALPRPEPGALEGRAPC